MKESGLDTKHIIVDQDSITSKIASFLYKESSLKKLSNLKAEVKDTLQLLFVLYDLASHLKEKYHATIFTQEIINLLE